MFIGTPNDQFLWKTLLSVGNRSSLNMIFGQAGSIYRMGVWWILFHFIFSARQKHHWTSQKPQTHQVFLAIFVLAGTSFAQILSSLEYWQLTNDQLGGSSVGLRCSLAWLKTRQAFDKAVALFNYLELWRCEAGGEQEEGWDFESFAFNFTSTSMVLVEF